MLVIAANAIGLILFLQQRSDRLLAALFDSMHPAWPEMHRAFAGFTLYAVPLLACIGIAALFLLRRIRNRSGGAVPADFAAWRAWGPLVAIATLMTAAVVLVFIEVLIFQDYGIHFYEFDVFGILADAALRRDLGIQPAEVARVTMAGFTLFGVELVLCVAAVRLAAWRQGAAARASAAAMLVCVPGGLALFTSSEREIGAARGEFESLLPLGRPLLLRSATGAHIPIAPRLGADGYPVLQPTDSAPRLARTPNILFFVPDGLRADMVDTARTPNFLRFADAPDVIHSRRHYSTGHVSEAGVFGLVYGLNSHAFNPFIEKRVPAWPLEVLRRNGYHTCFISSSRLNPYPTDQLVRSFDEVSFPANDDEAVEHLRRYVEARRADGRPYFVFAFFYTPHFPFTSAKPRFRKYPSYGPKSRTDYMNDVIQADDYLRQALEIVRDGAAPPVVLVTSDHGEEIREHGAFGHASPTFWNEKTQVPFALSLPGAQLTAASAGPALSSHVDVWPTIFDYLDATPRVAPASYSDGRSLLRDASARPAFLAGRFFPVADRPSLLTDSTRKYWFEASGLGPDQRLCLTITRVTTTDDTPVPGAPPDARDVPAFDALQRSFWRFVQPVGPQSAFCAD